MGRYDFSAHRVHAHATNLLRTANNQHNYPPPWYNTIGTIPPPQKLVRPALRRQQKPGKKSSRIFTPLNITYEEDKLRWEYFNDHPWELARPRVVLEDDGRDREKWDWSIELDFKLNRPRKGKRAEEWDAIWQKQAARPLNGESVIQRQMYLLRHTALSPAAAYDKARKELYRARHASEIETRVAREEALSTGAFFGLGPLEVGMKLEDQAYENWKAWAIRETEALKQAQGAAYTGGEADEVDTTVVDEEQEDLQQVAASVPGSKRGQEAKGGEAGAIHP